MPGGFALGEVDWYPDGTSLLFTAITEDKGRGKNNYQVFVVIHLLQG